MAGETGFSGGECGGGVGVQRYRGCERCARSLFQLASRGRMCGLPVTSREQERRKCALVMIREGSRHDGVVVVQVLLVLTAGK